MSRVRLPPGTPKNNRNRGCFVLFSGEFRAFFNAHCSAVEPSGWRFTFDASIFVTLFRRFAPSDSPRVHQWHSDFIAMPQLCLPFGKHNFTLAQAKISPPRAISFALSEFHSFNLLCNTKHSFLCGFPSGRLPRYARNDIKCAARSIIKKECKLFYFYLTSKPLFFSVRSTMSLRGAMRRGNLPEGLPHKNVHSTFVFSPRKNRPKYGRFFVVWIYCFLLKNALLILLLFVEQCFNCGD